MAALAYYASEVDYDLPLAERLGLDSVRLRVDEALAGEPITIGAEIALRFVALGRGDWDEALRWGASYLDRGRQRHDLSDHALGFTGRTLAWSFLGRYEEAQAEVEQMERYLGPHPNPMAAWFLHFSQGTAWARNDPDRAIRYFERGSDAATTGGVPFFAYITNRDAMAIRIGRLPADLAAAAVRDVLAGLWEARDVFNMRLAVAHTVVVCARAARIREAALIGGWLGPDAVPFAPHYAARLDNARIEIDSHLGDEAKALRSQGARSTPTTIVEHMLTTLTSIAETPGTEEGSQAAS